MGDQKEFKRDVSARPGPRRTPDVPPWEPIADWLARIEDADEMGNPTQNQIRKRHEKEAKAIAYDIATHGAADE